MENTGKKLLCEPRIVRGTLRKIWLSGGEIVKEYKNVRWPGDRTRPWSRDHNALCQLKRHGVAAPLSYELMRPEPGVIRHRREFVPGSHILEYDDVQLDSLALYLRDVHAAGVVNCDISPGNIIIADDGRLMLIDFGRSRIFPFRGLLFYWYVGKELARIRRRVFFADKDKWLRLCHAYHERVSLYPAVSWPVIRLSARFWMRLWGLVADLF